MRRANANARARAYIFVPTATERMQFHFYSCIDRLQFFPPSFRRSVQVYEREPRTRCILFPMNSQFASTDHRYILNILTISLSLARARALAHLHNKKQNLFYNLLCRSVFRVKIMATKIIIQRSLECTLNGAAIAAAAAAVFLPVRRAWFHTRNCIL